MKNNLSTKLWNVIWGTTFLVVIAISLAVSAYRFFSRREYRCGDRSVAQISMFGTALDAFKEDTGHYPHGRNGLLELWLPSQNTTNWMGPYMKGIPLDSWGHPYLYEYPGRHNTNSFDLYSVGPDGLAETEDDVTNWRK